LKRVLVVGAGIAGTAAALAASAAGASVTLLDGGTGASSLAPGAVDLTPWEARAPSTPDDALAAPSALGVLAALDLVTLPEKGVLVATAAGILRPARGADRALLDLAVVGPGVVVAPRAEHASWDAGALARSWNDTRLARDRGLEFIAIDATLTRLIDERHLAASDLAARHDDPARLEWLATRLKEAIARVSASKVVAVALPPWLGVEEARAAALSKAVGLPCGEAATGPGGPAGLRFENARDRALAKAGVAVVLARASAVERADGKWTTTLEQGDPLTADRVVLAAGGLIGGGLAYSPSASLLAGELPSRARPTFNVTIDAPVSIGVSGHALALPGSLFGETPETLAWPFTDAPLLERAGVLASSAGHVDEGLYVAGDLAANQARTWLAALVHGARAGEAAARG
jgi:glycerol-3-phosphate dehydrogenase subunit B